MMRLLILLGLSVAVASDWPLPKNATDVFLRYVDGLLRTPSVDTVPEWFNDDDE